MTLEGLREKGYSPKAIEDITFICEKHRAKSSKVEELLEQGYNPDQLDEIYGIARKFEQSLPKISRFYDRFKDKGDVSEMIERIALSIRGSKKLKLNQMIPFFVHSFYKHGEDFEETLSDLKLDYAAAQRYLSSDFLGGDEYQLELAGSSNFGAQDDVGRAMYDEFKHMWGFE